MRKVIFMISLLLLPLIVLPLSNATAQTERSKERKAKEEKAKGGNAIILTTTDLKQDYEILGLVYYRSSELDPKKIHEELRKQAKILGADYVIGITYYENAGYLYGSGTAVKLIEEDKSKK